MLSDEDIKVLINLVIFRKRGMSIASHDYHYACELEEKLKNLLGETNGAL